VARSGKRIVGFSVGVKEDENELKAIYVLPEYHGRGVGKLLIEPAMKWLGNEKDVVVWVFSHNNQAIRFYEKHGFVKSGKTSTWPVNGKPIPDLEMVKKCDARH
jgi:ribosomal protein S18 acetylase RimI-like enzyme